MPTDDLQPSFGLGLNTDGPDSQARFREALVKGWGIKPGDRVLEIGCGQGDTTVALAASGATVVAIDPAVPSYGSPLTLGEATNRILASDLGPRIQFKLHTDPLAECYAPDTFDAVVFAHCSWYFPSVSVLLQTFEKVRPWAPRLLFSEWDLTPSPDSLAHFLAVLIQGQIEAYKPESESNIRTPLSRGMLRSLLSESGWQVIQEATLDSSELDDGKWEVQACLKVSASEAKLHLPPRLQGFVGTQVDALCAVSAQTPAGSLTSYSLIAERPTLW